MDKNSSHDADLVCEDWGLIDYSQALEQQLKKVEALQLKSTAAQDLNSVWGYLIFCTHPPVVTLGRATEAADVWGWQGTTVEVARGGRATYHGPSQLVVYVVANIQASRKKRGPQEIGGFLRDFEQGIVDTLSDFGVTATGKTFKNKQERSHLSDFQSTDSKLKSSTESQKKLEDTGVWIGSRKIASLGIGVKNWITYHGAAINLDYDPEAFYGLNPCGYTPKTMISLEEVLHQKINRPAFIEKLKVHLLRQL